MFLFNKDKRNIDLIFNRLLATGTFLYFCKNDSLLIKEYKIFELKLFSAALYHSILIHKYDESEIENQLNEIKRIYFKNTSHFFNTVIRKKKLKLSVLDSDNIDDSFWILQIFTKFNRYLDDLNHLIISKKPYWIEEWDEPESDEEFGMKLTGEKHYYQFIYNIFLSRLDISCGNVPCIDSKDIWELEEFEYLYLQQMIDIICLERLSFK